MHDLSGAKDAWPMLSIIAERGAGHGASGPAPQEPIALVIWCAEAREELPTLSRGRPLLLDYFAARCCGRNVTIGDLDLRWSPTGRSLDAVWVPVRAPDPLTAYAHRDLVGILREARGRIVMRGRGPLRRAAIEVDDGAAWLDFVAACRPRSPLRR